MGTLRTRKRGKTFSYAFEAGTVNGRRKVIEKGGYPTKEAAYEAGMAAYTDWKHGNVGLTSTKIKLSEFSEFWMKNVAQLNVRRGTLASYDSALRNHVYPFLGDLYIQDITPLMVDRWMSAQAKAGFSYSTLRGAHNILQSILGYAVYPCQLISSNPVIYVKVPRNAPRKIIKRHIITREKLNEVLSAYPSNHYMHIVSLILYHTGMRIGEVLGLTYDEIDFEKRILHVRKQIRQVKGVTYYCELKTPSSVRDVFVDSALIQEILAWKQEQSAHENRLGKSYNKVYASPEGRVLQQSKAFPAPRDASAPPFICTHDNGRIVYAVAAQYHLRKLGLNTHSFRHTHATMLVEAGASAKGVSARLGHSKVDITQNLYTHATKRIAKETEAVFESLMDEK